MWQRVGYSVCRMIPNMLWPLQKARAKNVLVSSALEESVRRASVGRSGFFIEPR